MIASILRINGCYFLTHISDANRAVRVDHFERHNDSLPVLRLPVAPEDSMRCWEFVNPRELSARHTAYCAKERARIATILNRQYYNGMEL